MAAAVGGTRSVTHERATARCGDCHRVRPGVTRVENRPWQSKPARLQLCDECRASITARPLEDVIADLVGERF